MARVRPDGETLAGCALGGVTRVWQVQIEDAVETLCGQVGPEITPAEWEDLLPGFVTTRRAEPVTRLEVCGSPGLARPSAAPDRTGDGGDDLVQLGVLDLQVQ